MKNPLSRLLRAFILICLLCFASTYCLAQASADTTIPKNNQPLFPARTPSPDTAIVKAVDTTHRIIKTESPTKPGSLTRKQPFQPNPKRAGLYSAILPGLGQCYNRQYWKVPVIYAGLAVAGYFIADNLTHYQSYRKAYIGRINNPYPSDKYLNVYSSDQLQQLQNEYSKFLNLTVLFTGVGYTLQVLEAMTGAHLKNFDVSRDISMHLQPVAYPNALGLGMVVNFR